MDMRQPRRNTKIKISQDADGNPVLHAAVALGDKVQFVGSGKDATLEAQFKTSSPFDDKDKTVSEVPFNSEGHTVTGIPGNSYDFTVVALTDNPSPSDLIHGQIDIDP
jgi:hypothetical protein